MITQAALLAILRAKFAERAFRSWYAKAANGRLIRFVDWRD